MCCKKCGKDIGTKAKCPFCGAEQHSIDPFTTLGDIEPKKSNGNMEDCANNPIIPSAKPDCFSVLGDLEPSRDCFSEEYYTNNLTEKHNYSDPFHSMGNLDGSTDMLDDTALDNPAIGGFMPMDELILSEDGSETIDDQDLSETTGDYTPKLTFVWKKWMTIAACCTTIICVLLLAICSNSLSTTNDKHSVQSAVNALGNVLEAPILDVNTEGIETPAFLSSIESRNGYEILSFEKAQDGAVATMRVYAPDVYSVAKDLDSAHTYTSEDALMNALDNALRNASIVEKQVVIDYALTEEGYVPILTVEFLDAYYGGIYQLRDEIIADAAAEAEG